jgi:hypothetical protein
VVAGRRQAAHGFIGSVLYNTNEHDVPFIAAARTAVPALLPVVAWAREVHRFLSQLTHIDGCNFYDSEPRKDCDCGLAALLARVEVPSDE